MNNNYNHKNIENIRQSLNENLATQGNKVYRMVEKTVPCKVKIKKKSRVICAKSLLK